MLPGFVSNEEYLDSYSAEIINNHTIKPLDTKAIQILVQKTGCVLSSEEHNHLDGLGESGTPVQLMEKYLLNSTAIIKAVQCVLERV